MGLCDSRPRASARSVEHFLGAAREEPPAETVEEFQIEDEALWGAQESQGEEQPLELRPVRLPPLPSAAKTCSQGLSPRARGRAKMLPPAERPGSARYQKLVGAIVCAAASQGRTVPAQTMAVELLYFRLVEEQPGGNFVQDLSYFTRLYSYLPRFVDYEERGALPIDTHRQVFIPLPDQTNKPECSICLCPFEFGDQVYYLVCYHRFHYACLLKWAAIQCTDKCPVCRADTIGVSFV